jgi:hypothetical protein
MARADNLFPPWWGRVRADNYSLPPGGRWLRLIIFSLPTGGGGAGPPIFPSPLVGEGQGGGGKRGTHGPFVFVHGVHGVHCTLIRPRGCSARRPGATDPAFFWKRTRMRHSQADRTGGDSVEMDRDNRPVWMNQPDRFRCPIWRVRHPQTGFSCKKGGIGPPFRLSGGSPLWQVTPSSLAEESADCKPILSPLPNWARAANFSLPTGGRWLRLIIFSLPTGGGGSGWGRSRTSNFSLPQHHGRMCGLLSATGGGGPGGSPTGLSTDGLENWIAAGTRSKQFLTKRETVMYKALKN